MKRSFRSVVDSAKIILPGQSDRDLELDDANVY